MCQSVRLFVDRNAADAHQSFTGAVESLHHSSPGERRVEDTITISKAVAEKVLAAARMGLDTMDQQIRKLRESAYRGAAGPILDVGHLIRDEHLEAVADLNAAINPQALDDTDDGIPF
jgi:hypothetical protein